MASRFVRSPWGLLNQVPYATSPDAEQWVLDCIDVMPKLNQKVVLLAFFSNGDLKDKPDMQEATIKRLKKGGSQSRKGRRYTGH